VSDYQVKLLDKYPYQIPCFTDEINQFIATHPNFQVVISTQLSTSFSIINRIESVKEKSTTFYKQLVSTS
jgi:hypothetical protein